MKTFYRIISNRGGRKLRPFKSLKMLVVKSRKEIIKEGMIFLAWPSTYSIIYFMPKKHHPLPSVFTLLGDWLFLCDPLYSSVCTSKHTCLAIFILNGYFSLCSHLLNERNELKKEKDLIIYCSKYPALHWREL